MTVGYKYREFVNMPEIAQGELWATAAQLGMDLPDVRDNQIDPYSRITRLGRSEHEGYGKYAVEHEILRKWKVRFHDQVRNQVIVIENFSLYIALDGSHLLAATKDDICNDLLQRIQQQHPAFSFAGRVVDLVKMRQEMQMKVNGGHFSKLKIADVKSASIFGPTVSDSLDWERYEKSGEISALTLDLTWEGMNLSVQVSKSGGVVVYDPLRERDQLELVRVVNAMIGPYAETPKRNW